MALEPIKRKMTTKKVAGFHSFERIDLTEDVDGCGCRKNLGTTECHKDG